MACNALEPCQLKWSVFFANTHLSHSVLPTRQKDNFQNTHKIDISSMDPRHVSLLIQLLSVVQGFNNPLVDTRVYDKDYSVFLQGEINQSINHIQGVLVSESSWESSRLPPSVEKSIVSCATACIDKFRADFSCNAIMFVQETQECHFGNTTLTDENENEATEYVYRIPDGKGKIL